MFKKLIAIILALVLALSAATVFAYAEDSADSPEASEPKSVEVEFLYVPLKSRIVIGKFGPLFHGTVIRVTYPDGTSEKLTVKKTDNGYVAGDFTVDWNYFYTDFDSTQLIVLNYGANSGVFGIRKENSEYSYYGEELFNYFIIPSPAEIAGIVYFCIKIIGSRLNPLI